MKLKPRGCAAVLKLLDIGGGLKGLHVMQDGKSARLTPSRTRETVLAYARVKNSKTCRAVAGSGAQGRQGDACLRAVAGRAVYDSKRFVPAFV